MALKTLPSTLYGTYSEAFQRIQDQAPDLVRVAESVLFWVICAHRPLSILELRHIYATRDLADGDTLSEEDLPDGEILTSTCGGMVMIDAESQTVRPVHYTTQEYFERSHLHLVAVARFELADISLVYLMLPNFSDGACKTDAAMAQRLEQYPFLDYAGKHWGIDLEDLTGTQLDLFWPRLMRFASRKGAMELASQCRHNRTPLSYEGWSQGYPHDVPILSLAAGFHMPSVLRRLMAQSHPVDGKGRDGFTALMRAAMCGRTENVKVLLDHGADANTSDSRGITALHLSALVGEPGSTQALLDASAEVNAKTLINWTPLMFAATRGMMDVVKALVKAGADQSGEGPQGQSAISLALTREHLDVVTFLVDEGGSVPRNVFGRMALSKASDLGLHDLVQRLTASYETRAEEPVQQGTPVAVKGLQLATVLEGS
jgi:hypothetical protein